MQVLQLPPGNGSQIIQTNDLSALKDVDHEGIDYLSVRGVEASPLLSFVLCSLSLFPPPLLFPAIRPVGVSVFCLSYPAGLVLRWLIVSICDVLSCSWYLTSV